MASTALHSDTADRIALLKTRRDALETQIMRVVTGGQAFGVPGGVNITQVPLAELRKELERIKREILLYTSGSGAMTVLPDFSESGGVEDVPT